MKKINLIIIVFTSFNLCFAQSDTTYFDSKWNPCKKMDASFFRLVSANNGSYIFTDYYLNGTPQMIAISSQKDSLYKNGICTFFHEDGKKSSEGLYKNNKPIGIWHTWKGNDSTEFKYKSDGSSIVLKDNRYTKAELALRNNTYTLVEQMPEFYGGESAMYKFIQNNIKYPLLALEKGIKGKVYISFVIDQKGNVVVVELIRGIGGGCDEEAMRVIRNMPKWIPGKQSGKRVRVRCSIPIEYSLD